MLEGGWQQALTVLVVVIPGFVYQGVRARYRGPTPEDKEFSVRILRALAQSIRFALAYAMVGGLVLTFTGMPHRPKELRITGLEILGAAALVFALVFVIPAAIAVWTHIRAVKKLYPGIARGEWFDIYNPTPTAWDFASSRVGPGFVRVLLSDGRWVGGYADKASFFSSYPESREIFVEKAYEVDDQGGFQGIVTNTAGRWIKCDDALVVDFLEEAEPATGATAGGEAKIWWTPLVLGLVLLRWWGSGRS